MIKRAKRIHITSSGPRTGTTLLAEVMKTCFTIDCFCSHEAPISLSNSSFGECDTILTKMPSSTKHMERILSWDPNLFIIILIRDPRDMVCSFHGKVEDKYYCDFQFWFDFTENYKILKGSKRVLLIKYEELTKNPDVIQNRIMEAMPFLSKTYNFSEFHLYSNPGADSIKALKKLRPIESKGIGNWKNHLPRIKQQINQFGSINASLIKYGYEEDEKWTRVLDDVESIDYVSFKNTSHMNPKSSKFFTIKFLLLTYLNIFLEKRGVNPDKLLAPFKSLF